MGCGISKDELNTLSTLSVNVSNIALAVSNLKKNSKSLFYRSNIPTHLELFGGYFDKKLEEKFGIEQVKNIKTSDIYSDKELVDLIQKMIDLLYDHYYYNIHSRYANTFTAQFSSKYLHLYQQHYYCNGTFYFINDDLDSFTNKNIKKEIKDVFFPNLK